ncbi:syntaxin-2-like isoform X2 [Megalops cyprinoides]|uniref:syntaxin-2-like isoform X2 n=1 Tax=Megalops cyprinoides TaxID=118141 RepID=UPI001864F2FD|nr:syntaxin-2-like isoform X2 [Megalops cyprinoides]
MKDRLADLTVSSKNGRDDVTVPVERESFMEGFFRKVEETRRLIDQIASQVEEVKKKYSCILSAPDPDDRMKGELERLSEDIKKNARTVQAGLKTMQQGLPQDEDAIRASVNLRIQKTQHSQLSRRFVEVMTLYSEAQVAFREKSKGRILRQLEITGKSTTNEELENMLESGNASVFISDVISDSQITRQALNEIESRHQDILRLESSIRELHEMFQDMAMLVETQGEMINNIEKNVNNAAEYVARAEKETKKAVRYQSNARRKALFLAIFVSVGVIVLAIIIGTTVS